MTYRAAPKRVVLTGDDYLFYKRDGWTHEDVCAVFKPPVGVPIHSLVYPKWGDVETECQYMEGRDVKASCHFFAVPNSLSLTFAREVTFELKTHKNANCY